MKEKAYPKAMKKAHEQSLKSSHPKYQLGAVIVSQGKIYAMGMNHQEKTHPYIFFNGEHFNRGIHAEISAIFKVKNKENLKGATMFVYRQTKNGDMANARPCKMCYELIKKHGIKRIVYTTPFGIIVEKVR